MVIVAQNLQQWNRYEKTYDSIYCLVLKKSITDLGSQRRNISFKYSFYERDHETTKSK